MVVEYTLSTCKAMHSIPRRKKKREEGERRREKRREGGKESNEICKADFS